MIENNDNKDVLINDLKVKLIEYRKNKAKKKNIPAFYIFTNVELDKILDLLPKKFEELKKSGILSTLKLNTYGKEIVKIINSI